MYSTCYKFHFPAEVPHKDRMQFLADFLGRFDAIYSYTITDKAVTLHNFRPDHARKIEKALETSDIEGVILLDDVIG